MKLRRRQKQPERETVVALVDVTFFLLVFFMLVGRLDATAPFSVVPPLGVTGTDLPAGGITLSVASDGALALDGAPITLATVGIAVAARIQANPHILIRINADRATELRPVLTLVSQFEGLGAKDVALIVTPDLP